jgi:hypothetical protein
MDNGRKRIIRKIENDNDTVESSFFNVASLIMGGKRTMATEELRRQSARTSVEELCRYFHVPYEKSADRLDDVDVQIDRMLRPSGYMRRAVTLDEDWWKNSRSAMLCHAKDGTTVALIPRSYSGYTFFDYSQGKRLKVDAQTASLLTEKAVMFYRPLPQQALSRHDLFSFFLTLSNGRDYLLFLLLALALTALSLVMPWAIRFLFSKLVPVGEVSLVVTLFLMLSGVAVSQALVGVSRDLVRSRISLGVEDGFQSAVMARMMYFPSSFFSRYSSGELTEVTDAFNRLPSLMANLLLGSGLTVLLSLVYLAQIHLFGPVPRCSCPDGPRRPVGPVGDQHRAVPRDPGQENPVGEQVVRIRLQLVFRYPESKERRCRETGVRQVGIIVQGGAGTGIRNAGVPARLPGDHRSRLPAWNDLVRVRRRDEKCQRAGFRGVQFGLWIAQWSVAFVRPACFGVRPDQTGAEDRQTLDGNGAGTDQRQAVCGRGCREDRGEQRQFPV